MDKSSPAYLPGGESSAISVVHSYSWRSPGFKEGLLEPWASFQWRNTRALPCTQASLAGSSGSVPGGQCWHAGLLVSRASST